MASSMTYDFIIVGGGTAGCLLASRLAQSAAKPDILLLEAGGENSDVELRIPAQRFTASFIHKDILDHGYKSIAQPFLHGREIPYFRGKGLGGTTSLNSCIWDYGSPHEMDTWASLVDDDVWTWKNSLEILKTLENVHYDEIPDILKHYIDLAPGSHGNDGPIDVTLPTDWVPGLKLIFDAAESYGLPLTPDLNSSRSMGIGPTYATTHAGFRITAASAYLKTKLNNLVVRTECQAARVLMKDHTAVGVELCDGTRYYAKREVILSAGAVDTPKLLLLSGVGSSEILAGHGIPEIVNLPGVGKRLLDHPLVRIQYALKHGVIPETPHVDMKKAKELWVKDKTGPLAADPGQLAVGYFKLESSTHCEEFQSLSKGNQVLLSHQGVPSYELCLAIRTPLTAPDGSSESPSLIMLLSLMNGQSAGSVTISSSDPTSPPVIDLNYLSHAYDQRIMVDAVRASLQFAENSSLPIEGLIVGPKGRSEGNIMGFLKEHVSTLWHAMGTAKMGSPGDRTACVDKEFRVIGTQNLRVADMSVAPLVVNNHPQSTAYLIGEIAARKLISVYDLDP